MKGGLRRDKMGGFTQFQVASSIPLAAQNEGGLAGIGAGLGAGMAVGQAMAQGMGGAFAQQPRRCRAAASAPADSIEDRLGKAERPARQGLDFRRRLRQHARPSC